MAREGTPPRSGFSLQEALEEVQSEWDKDVEDAYKATKQSEEMVKAHRQALNLAPACCALAVLGGTAGLRVFSSAPPPGP